MRTSLKDIKNTITENKEAALERHRNNRKSMNASLHCI